MQWLIGVLVSFGAWIVERIAKYFLGIGAFGVAYVGASVLINRVFSSMVSQISGVGDGYTVFLMAGMGQAINVLLSACAFRLAMAASKEAAK